MVDYVLFRRFYEHVEKVNFGCREIGNTEVLGDSIQDLARQYSVMGSKLIFGDTIRSIPRQIRCVGRHIDRPVEDHNLEEFEKEFSRLSKELQ
jgi:hypothetical protein